MKLLRCYKIPVSIQEMQSFSSPHTSAVITPLCSGCTWKPELQTKTNRLAGSVSREPSCVFVCGVLIEALPGLLLLHQHVWSPPRVLEIPLERIRQDLCHLCRKWERQQSCQISSCFHWKAFFFKITLMTVQTHPTCGLCSCWLHDSKWLKGIRAVWRAALLIFPWKCSTWKTVSVSWCSFVYGVWFNS